MNEVIISIIASVIVLAISTVIAIIGFYVKGTIRKVDCCQEDINSLSDKFATQKEVEEIKTSMQKINEDISEIKDKSISKQDFVREMDTFKGDFVREITKLQDSQSKIIDILVHKGGQ